MFNKKTYFKSNRNFGLSKLKRILVIGIACVIFLYGIIYATAFLMTRIAFLELFMTLNPKSEMKGINVLALGVDDTLYSKRSDTIIVFHLDPAMKRIGIIAIPRDTRVNIEGHGFSKINHAYAFGGVPLLRDTVSRVLGIPIDYYVKVNLDGVAKIVDELGGVTIDVEKNLFYRDQAAGLYIDIKEGEQEMNGDQVLQYIRFRHDENGDIGRIGRQQKFMQSVAEKLLASTGVIELPLMMKRLNSVIDTDLSISKLVSTTVQFAEAFKDGYVEKGTLPGQVTMIDGVSYWKPNITKSDQMIEYLIHGFDSPVSDVFAETVSSDAAEDRRIVTMQEVSRVTEETEIEQNTFLEPPLIVEVLNGVGRAGLGAQVSAFLSQRQINVFNTANAGHFNYEETVIVDWKGDLDRSLYLANLLKIDPSRIIVYDKPDKPLDVTLVVGHDWDSILEKLQEVHE